MREIKFRGIRIANGEWVYGGYYRYSNGMVAILTHEDIGCQYWTSKQQVDPETVGQFTGLKDKSGKEIFEGDIFRTSLGFVAVVGWDDDNGRFLGFIAGGERKIMYISREPAVDVIGNIYENPELMEVE